MRFLPIDKVEEGMMIAQEVFDSHGRMLVASGLTVTDTYIEKLVEQGIAGIYIDDEFSAGIQIPPLIPPRMKTEAMNAVRECDIDSCMAVAQSIVEEILKNGIVSINLTDLRSYDDYTFAHSVNVAVMACTIGFGLKWEQSELEDIVLAALLHDIGKLVLPQELINKPERLTKEEFALVKTHPLESWELLRERLDLDSFVKSAVLSHHENYDGSGYPNGLAKNSIHKYARLLHVVDVYDALVSKRPYKEPYSPYAAIEILKGGTGTLYDPEYVEEFLRHVPIYPKGSMVILPDGRDGLVIENSGEHNEHPIIRLQDMTEMDLLAPENIEIKVSTIMDASPEKLIEGELSRSEMLQPLDRKYIMILDKQGQTFLEANKALSYMYDFKHVQTENQAEGFIKKDGYPELLLVDIDGIEYNSIGDLGLRAMNRQLAEKVPILVIGTYNDVETIRSFRAYGVRNYILKPYNMVYLQSEISRILGNQFWD